MRTIFLVIVTIILLSFTNSILAKDNSFKSVSKPIQYNFGNQYHIHSKILSEDRKLLVYVPEKYQGSSDKFPVLYLLQGNVHYKHAVISAEKIQKSGWMPASIIVAITDNDGTTTRDYRNESDKFLNFINKEVQPFIANNFRVNGFKSLFGHLESGKFVLDTFLKDPTQFDIYISANARIREDTIKEFESFLEKNSNFNQALYFSMGTVLDNGSYNVEPAKKLADLLSNKAPKSLQWKYQYLPLHGAYSSANVTLYDALSEAFTDYQGPFIYSYQDYIDGDKMEGVEKYFRERAAKYHISDDVTIGSLMGVGFMLLDSGYPQESVKMLLENIKNRYPESIQLYRVLGRAYLKMEENELAIKAYEVMVKKAEEQNSPQLDRFKDTLERVKVHILK